jgi:thiamine-monophosphate kinase
MDISDGLVADLPRLLEASNLVATVQVDSLPLSPALCAARGADSWRFAAAGGDDYELLIAAPASRRGALLAAAQSAGTALAEIGVLSAAGATAPEARVSWQRRLDLMQPGITGFDHFGG